MAFGIGSLVATLGLETGGYSRGILNAQALNQAFGQSFTSFVANPVAGGIALINKLARGFIRASGNILQTAQDLRRLSQETGASTDLIQALSKALEANGASAEAARQGLAFFANQLATARQQGGPAADAIERLGLNLDALGGSDDAMRTILDSLAAIADDATRAALATDLFGRQAGPALANQVRTGGGSVRALEADIRSLGQIIDRDGIENLNVFKDSLGRLEQNLDGIKTQALVAFFRGLGGGDLNTDSWDDIASSIRDKLVPAMEKLGATSAKVLNNLEKIDEILQRIPWLNLRQPDDYARTGGLSVEQIEQYERRFGLRDATPEELAPFAGRRPTNTGRPGLILR